MVRFKTIIVLDIETTSLPQKDHNTSRMTELALVGCEVEHLKESKGLPRVLHKLVLLFNPNKMIHPEATKVSGLSNELLNNVKPFRREDVEVLRQFIDRLPQPVCIVAHNGNKFDFPILKRALDGVKMELQNNVYCADSILAFRSLLPGVAKSHSNSMKTPPRRQPQPFNSLQRKKVIRQLFPDGEDTQRLSASESTSRILKSYKLVDIYYFFFDGYFLACHRAEEDSKALLSCVMKCNGFLEWINENSVLFNSIPSLF